MHSSAVRLSPGSSCDAHFAVCFSQSGRLRDPEGETSCARKMSLHPSPWSSF